MMMLIFDMMKSCLGSGESFLDDIAEREKYGIVTEFTVIVLSK